MYDTLGSSNILFVAETDAILVMPLLDMRHFSGVRGSGGVICLTRDSLRNMVSLVVVDEFARFMRVGLEPEIHVPGTFT